ncbi:MAG: hypothetical protein V1694_08720 [Candidatus Eisenbacteria bacterium]
MRLTWRSALGTIIACVALFFIVRSLRSSLGELGSYRFAISPWRIGGAFAVFVLLFPIYGAVWQYITRKFGYPLSFAKSTRIWLLSQAGRYVPGKVWFALGRIYLAEREGVPKSVTTVAMALELALVLGSSVLVFGLATYIRGSLAGHPYAWSLGLVPLIVIGVHPRIVKAVLARLGKGHGEFKMSYLDILKLLVIYVVCWCIYGVGFYLIGTSLVVTGTAAGPHSVLTARLLPEMIGINALAWTVGFVSVITPAGLGIREGVATFLLLSLLDKPYPSLIPLVARVWVTVAEVGAIGLVLMLRTRR